MATKLHFREHINKQLILFPERIDKDIAPDDPVRLVDAVVDGLDMNRIYSLYYERGASPYHPRMMLKVIIYGYMNNIYSCRKIEVALKRDVHFIWLAGYDQPDYKTINNFRNRVKEEIDNVFTQLVLILAERGLVSLDVEYIDGTKIESKANKYTFVWRKTVEKNRAKLMEKIGVLLSQIDDAIAQDNADSQEKVEFTPAQLGEICDELRQSLARAPEPACKQEKEALRKQEKEIKRLEQMGDKLSEYDGRLEQIGERNSMSKTDPDATFMRMKEDAMNNGQTKPGYNVQIATENQFITDFGLFHNPTDTLTLPTFLSSFRSRYGHMPDECCADSGYGSEENYRFMEEHSIEAFVKYNYFHKELRDAFTSDPFRTGNLHYNAHGDYFVCPMGQHMTRVGSRKSRTASGYVSDLAVYRAQRCRGCPLRGSCHKGGQDNREIVVNHRLDGYRRKARERLTSEKGLTHRSRRPIEPEAVFGQMKFNMAYRRFRHFGQDKVTMDFAFLAIAFNIKKWAAKTAKSA
ncbi:MAG: IS1182 family transposase [Muribaculaceae bacterium]|nr:IS1182 family transposase [Muribaculaceae bacterium]